jgi:endonuclease-3 related protein
MSDRTLHHIYDALLDALGPQDWWPGETPFEVMAGAVLTQNTAWGNVERAVANLKAADALTAWRLLELPDARLGELIRPSGYFNVKARRLKGLAAWLTARTGDGDPLRLRGVRTPRLRAELLAVRGVGPETADSILLYALNRRVFVVDAYTRRVLSRHGLVAPGAPYESVRAFIEARVPKSRKLYNEFHALIVNLGKNICRPTPHCAACPLRGLLGAPIVRTSWTRNRNCARSSRPFPHRSRGNA